MTLICALFCCIIRIVSLDTPRMRPLGKYGTFDKETEAETDERDCKKRRIDASDSDPANSDSGAANSDSGAGNGAEMTLSNSEKNSIWNKWVAPADLPSRPLLVARPLSEMKGHTAFLTFAVRPSRTKLNKEKEEATDDGIADNLVTVDEKI